MVNDPVGDFIVQIKNANAAGRERISVPYSKLRLAVAQKLEQGGFIGAIAKRGKKARKCLEVTLRYPKKGEAAILGVNRISKPGRRLYAPVSGISRARGIRGVTYLSTPKGILTDAEAKKEHVGGELLFTIW